MVKSDVNIRRTGLKPTFIFERFFASRLECTLEETTHGKMIIFVSLFNTPWDITYSGKGVNL